MIAEPERILFVCTGNQCRSPTAEALLRAQLPPDSNIVISSAGTAGDGTPPPRRAVKALRAYGLDIEGRPSRPLTPEEIEASDLIITMTSAHLAEVAVMHPPAFERTFTLLDLVDRAQRAGPRMPGESLREWARRLSGGRTRAAALQGADVADPMGGSMRDYDEVCRTLATQTKILSRQATCSPP